MLSLRQIGQMLGMPGIGEQERLVGVLVRYRWVRFASVLVNVLVMWMTLPTFLLRQPASLLVRSMACAGIAVPAMLGAAVFMMADLPGIAPQVSVFLPVAVFIPIAIAQWMYVKT